MKVNILGFPSEAGHLVSLLRGLVDDVEVTGTQADPSGELVMISLEVTVKLPWLSIERPSSGELWPHQIRAALRGEGERAPAPDCPGERRRPRRIH
jgi:hypothetical protein